MAPNISVIDPQPVVSQSQYSACCVDKFCIDGSASARVTFHDSDVFEITLDRSGKGIETLTDKVGVGFLAMHFESCLVIGVCSSLCSVIHA